MYDQIKINSVDKDHIFQISSDDVITAISSLKQRKAPGADNITNEHILYSDNLIVECLCKLYNAIINIGYVHLNGNEVLSFRFIKEALSLKTLVTATVQ